MVDGLYHTVEEKNQCLVNNLSNFKTNDIDVRHFRLGHPSKRILEYICKNNIEIQYDDINSCDHCYYAKQHRLCFSDNNFVTHDIFELIHLDIWGQVLLLCMVIDIFLSLLMISPGTLGYS